MADRKLTEVLKQMADDQHDLDAMVRGLPESPAKRDLVTAVEDLRKALTVASSHRDADQPPADQPSPAGQHPVPSTKGPQATPNPVEADDAPKDTKRKLAAARDTANDEPPTGKRR